jgi:hypothetical protein
MIKDRNLKSQGISIVFLHEGELRYILDIIVFFLREVAR